MVDKKLMEMLRRLFRIQSERVMVTDDYAELCDYLGVVKMYYDQTVEEKEGYRDIRTGLLFRNNNMESGRVVLYDSGEETGDFRMEFPYYVRGTHYVTAYLEFKKGINEKKLDKDLFQFLSDLTYVLVSRQKMRKTLYYAEYSDMMTGIPNVLFIKKKYNEIIQTASPYDYTVLYVNLKNFRVINEVAGVRAGDEAIIQYSQKALTYVAPNEGVCRMGGDNFVFFVKNEKFEELLNRLKSVKISDLKASPEQTFEISAWVGVSRPVVGEKADMMFRINEAAIACTVAKTRMKQEVVYFTEELKKMSGESKRIIAAFKPAVERHEFKPYFQPKVDMLTGELVGLEALCRWQHGDTMIYPDKFIPALDKEGLIHELDMTILRNTCEAVAVWKSMNMNPVRVSCNFSRKNLFVPDIEEKIINVIREYGLSESDIEIEITESVMESEYDRLLEFTKKLHAAGLSLAVDDFGTGYSSLSLIHNIDADIIKIDKSFVDELTVNEKSRILIESIISIASRLNMSVIAEGVETREQGRALLAMGCNLAQGYYYGKPVDFETATGIVQSHHYEPVG